MRLDRRLSVLEFTVLGIVLKKAPCTAYSVMSEFTNSASSAYRSGAGSVYPLMRRLEKAGLLRSEPRGVRSRRYLLSEEGLAALRAWFALDPEEDISCCLDVLRSRTYFLKVLAPDEVARFIENSIAGLSALLERCEAQVAGYRESGDRFSELAMTGALMETRARLEWMRLLRDEQRETRDAWGVPGDA